VGVSRRVTAVRLSVDQVRCEGFGYCENEAPDLLHLDDEGDLVVDVEEIDDSQAERAQAAVRVCPVAALTIQ
jgi:ferredoxin